MSLDDSFYALSPENVLSTIDQFGLHTTGQYNQLNSYENRVYEIYLEDSNNFLNSDRVIGKFYRPNRWSPEALKDEHSFTQELKSDGLTVIAPEIIKGESIFKYNNILFCLFKKFSGRMPQELSASQLHSVGQTLARLHNVGEQRVSKNRPTLNADEYGWFNLDRLQDFIELDMRSRYNQAAGDILSELEEQLNTNNFLRIHGDCHKGNLLLKDLKDEKPEFFFVDFDDTCNGPAIQDFWMLLSSMEDYDEELDHLLSGYDELHSPPTEEIKLIPLLRGLRIIYYSAWIAKRWKDPMFPHIFPLFTTYDYWQEEVQILEDLYRIYQEGL